MIGIGIGSRHGHGEPWLKKYTEQTGVQALANWTDPHAEPSGFASQRRWVSTLKSTSLLFIRKV